MSSKADPSNAFAAPAISDTRLELDASVVHIRENGIEFLSQDSIPAWTEVRVALHSEKSEEQVQAQGVVVSSVGDRHAGFVITMVFLELSPVDRESLSRMAFS